jgi:Fe2+ or Zn2+ uptake regulation protein
VAATTHDARLDSELTDALRARGMRVTLPRLLVHRHVRRADQHVTAEQVQRELGAALPSLSPATIYATLDALEGLGLVRRVSTPDGVALYDSRTDDHHHAICRRCRAVVDLDADADTSLARTAARRSGFAVEHAEVQVLGVCAACAAADG